jgi:hypothetical protein
MNGVAAPYGNLWTHVAADGVAVRSRVVAAIRNGASTRPTSWTPPHCDVFDGWRKARTAIETGAYKVAMVDSELGGGENLVDAAVDRCVPVLVLAFPDSTRKKVLDLIRSGAVSCIRQDEIHGFSSLLKEVDTASKAGIPGFFEHLRDRLHETLGVGGRSGCRGDLWEGDLYSAVAEGTSTRVMKHPLVRRRAI